jgi:hypothetical protein
MRILLERPPRYDEIVAAFPAAATMRPVFAWGDAIYNPHRIQIDQHLLAHEGHHGMTQHPAVGGPDAWWDRYLVDPEWRVEQELEAYIIQYKSFCGITRNREARHKYAYAIAQQVSGPLYGSIIPHWTAFRRIRQAP